MTATAWFSVRPVTTRTTRSTGIFSSWMIGADGCAWPAIMFANGILCQPTWTAVIKQMLRIASVRPPGRPTAQADDMTLERFGNVGALLKAHFRPLTKHSFRRGAAQAIARLLGDPTAIMAMTGHRNIQALQRYIPDLYRTLNIRASAALVNANPAPAPPVNLARVGTPPPEPYDGLESDSDVGSDTSADRPSAPAATSSNMRLTPTRAQIKRDRVDSPEDDNVRPVTPAKKTPKRAQLSDC